MEHLLIPFHAESRIPCQRAIVFAPHPDDEVFGCGGAIMRHVEYGEAVQIIVVTDGAFHAPDDAQAYIQQRQNESKAAAALIGCDVPVFWSFPDRSLCYGEQLIEKIIAAIRAFRADLVYAPSVLEMHPDHRVLGMATAEAVRRIGSSLRLAAYEVGIPLTPNLLLNISDLIERKQAAMACYVSQNAKQRYDLDIAALNRYRSYTLPPHVTAAEAYLLVTAEALQQDPFRLYQTEYKRQRALGLPLVSQDLPLVSVIIRSIDRATLADALDSVALQTYPNIEVIVVNAKGATHRSLDAWCGRFPLRFISTDESPGRSRAANIGLKAARGELLIFLDDDDIFLPHHIARLKKELDQNPDEVAAYSAVTCVNPSGQEIRRYARPFDPVKLRIDNYIPIHSILFRRFIIDQGAAFDEQLDLCEDWDFWLQVLGWGEFSFVAEIGAVYRIDQEAGSGIWRDTSLLRKAIIAIYQKWAPHWDEELLWSLMEYARSKDILNEKEQLFIDMQKDMQKTHKKALRDIKEALEMRDRELVEAKKLLFAFQNSRSWRLTAPLRKIVQLFK